MRDVEVLMGRLKASLAVQPQLARTALLEQLARWPAQLASLRTVEGRQIAWCAARPLLVFAAAYIAAWSYLFVAAFLGAQPPPAPLFPPGAVLLCAILLTPPRRWWLYLVAAFVLQVPILAYLHLPLLWNVLGFIPDAIEPVIAASLMLRFMSLPPRFAGLREVSIYTACVVVAVMAAATVGSILNASLGGEPYGSSWRLWFLSDTLADLVLAPTLLLWIAAGLQGLRAASRWRYAEAGALYGGLLLLGVVVFDTHLFGPEIADAMRYLPVPLLLWAAVRFGPRGITSALSLIVVLSVPAVANVTGPFASTSIPDQSVQGHVFALQLFLLVIGVPLIFLAALVEERKQAAEAMRMSEARFRAAFASAASGMMLVDPGGRVLQANQPLVEMLGYSEVELRTHTFMELTYPEDLAPNLALLQRALAGEIDSYQIEKRFLHKSGHLIWGRVSAGVVRDAVGQPLYLVGQVEDITARKRLELEREAARAEAERQAEELDRVFEAVADGIAVYDQDGREVKTNAALQCLLRLDLAPAEYAHMSLHERMALFAARDHHGRPLTLDEGPLPRALAGEATEALDLRSRTLDGRELELNVSAAPLRNRAGQPVGVVCVFRDQTERKRLEREVAEQAEQLDRIVEGMGEGLFVYDTQGRVVRTNAAARRLLGLAAAPPEFFQLSAEERITLYAPNAPRDSRSGQVLTPEEWLAARAFVGNGDVLSTVEARDVRLRTLDGRELEVSASVAPLRDPDGQVVGVVLLLSDRTERNQLVREREEARASELALREVNQRLDTFVAVAAHDLRQPVTVTKLEIAHAQRQVQRAGAKAQQVAEKHTAPFAHVETALDAAQHQLDRLWRLMQQLLDVTRAQQGILTLNRQPCRLEALVRARVEEQRLLTPSRTIILDLPETGAMPVMVDADAERLGQVLTNYLANAVRYSPGDQPIEVALQVVERAPEDEGEAVARVAVRDHGPGIAPEEQATIWDRFQRAHSTSEASGGLGLGLYIVRTIIARHGGHVGVKSAVGEGAIFWFALPLSTAKAGDAEFAGVRSVQPPAHDDVVP
jgi:PAS domain S-box-containing protein